MSNERDINGTSEVRPVKFGHSNIYLIETERGHILVDAGMPNKRDELDEILATAGVDPTGVHLIILTHGHLDHVGSVAHAQKVTGAQVLCHRAFSDSLVKGKVEPAVAQNLLGRVLNIMTGLMGGTFEATTPDIVMDDEYDLNQHGLPGKVIHTPGHSPSSISIILDNGEALIGDLVRDAGSDEIGFGMFYADKKELLESLEKVTAFEPNTVYMSHSTYTDTNALKDFIVTTR